MGLVKKGENDYKVALRGLPPSLEVTIPPELNDKRVLEIFSKTMKRRDILIQSNTFSKPSTSGS